MKRWRRLILCSLICNCTAPRKWACSYLWAHIFFHLGTCSSFSIPLITHRPATLTWEIVPPILIYKSVPPTGLQVDDETKKHSSEMCKQMFWTHVQPDTTLAYATQNVPVPCGELSYRRNLSWQRRRVVCVTARARVCGGSCVQHGTTIGARVLAWRKSNTIVDTTFEKQRSMLLMLKSINAMQLAMPFISL